jgi:hypothetical protein
MNDQSFPLQPFSPLNPLLSLKITGNIALRSHTLTIRYALLAPLTKLMIPLTAEHWHLEHPGHDRDRPHQTENHAGKTVFQL